jgi:CNT family concentrative nucleoside transporter
MPPMTPPRRAATAVAMICVAACWLARPVLAQTAPSAAITAPAAGTPALAEATTQAARSTDRAVPQQGHQLQRHLDHDGGWLPRYQAIFGIIVMIALCWMFRERRPGQRFPWRVVTTGLLLQVLLAAFILKTSLGEPIFGAVNDAFVALMNFSNQGARFLFGDTMDLPHGLVAFSVLPTIIFFSALMTVGYHSGVMVRIVRVFSRFLARWMGTSGAESLSTVGNIFLGQTEAPLMVKPFLAKATRSELHCIMVSGFGTVAGGVMAAYVDMLHTSFPNIAGHLLTASIMAAPATVLVSKLLVPETEKPVTGPKDRIEVPRLHENVIDAAASGASDGVALALNVGGMLIAFIALVALANAVLGWTTAHIGLEGITLQRIFGWLFTPIAWLIGISPQESHAVGSLLGIKIVLNEFVAYLDLAKNLSGAVPLSDRATIITAYALCGFANFSSIAIQIGGIAGMVPERRRDLAALGLRAMLGGSVVGYMTAGLVGLLL